MTRFGLAIASITWITFLPTAIQFAVSQEYTFSPGYDAPAPTQAQIDAANAEFLRIRKELGVVEPGDPSDEKVSTEGPVPSESLPIAPRSIGPGGVNGPPVITRASMSAAAASSATNRIGERTSGTGSFTARSIVLASNGLLTSSRPSDSKTDSHSGGLGRIEWWRALQDLAKISGMSLDWTNLPGGDLDGAILEGRSPAEARDALYKLLLSLGYTLIERDKRWSVVKLVDLSPAIVPLVPAEDLDQYLPHQFVRVEFALKYIMAKPMATELAPRLSPNGRICEQTPRLPAAGRRSNPSDNCLVILDLVESLRMIDQLIAAAELQAVNGGQQRSFPLEVASPGRMRRQLERFVALHQSVAPEQPLPSWIAASPATFKIQIAEDRAINGVSTYSLPKQIESLESFIQFADLPSDRSVYFSHDMICTRVYRLTAVDPRILADVLAEVQGFNATEKLVVDEPNHAVVVHGSSRDHQVVDTLLRKLNNGQRRAEVIQFHRTPASALVDSIRELFVVHENRAPSGSERFAGQNQLASDDHSNAFRVSTEDVPNQLRLWCTENERREIHELLVKLGAWRDDADGWIRVVRAGSESEPQTLLDELRRVIPSIDVVERVALAADATAERPPRQLRSRQRIPVHASLEADGRIILVSQDFRALDAAAATLVELTRDRRGDRVFPIQNRSAFWIRLNLEMLFGSPGYPGGTTSLRSVASDRNSNGIFATSDVGLQLDDDPNANTLLVRGATPRQMQTIEWLIAVNDDRP